jgi:hypothetical protein
MNSKTFIYGLYDLNDEKKEIRYIGKADNPEYRLKRHKNNTKYNKKINKKLTHKENWVVSCDYNIDFIILRECDKNEWSEIEKELIKKYKRLTNTSSGGEGGSGLKYYISYEDCKKWIKENVDIKSKNEWYNNLDKLSDFIPKNPVQRYKNDGWVSWGDFLDTGRISDNYVDYLSYGEAKKIIKQLNIKKIVDYKKLTKNGEVQNNIPNRPERYYKNRGWVNWGDFLGCEIIANQNKKFFNLEEFKINIKKLNIKKMSEYKKYCLSSSRDERMPTNPLTVYRREDKNVSWLDIVNP